MGNLLCFSLAAVFVLGTLLGMIAIGVRRLFGGRDEAGTYALLSGSFLVVGALIVLGLVALFIWTLLSYNVSVTF